MTREPTRLRSSAAERIAHLRFGYDHIVTYTQGIDLLLAALNAVVAGYVIIQSRRWTHRVSTPAIVLAVYFGLRSAARLSDVATSSDAPPAELLLDVLLAATLLTVMATFEPVLRGIAARDDAARYRATEYERARRHYVQIVRHRLLNPVTVIKGSAQTLQLAEQLNAATREQLIESIVAACDEIEQISLVPERRDALEHDLDATAPRDLDDRRRPREP